MKFPAIKRPPLLEIIAWALPLAVAVAAGGHLFATRSTDAMRELARARDELRVINTALLAPRPDDKALPKTAEGLAALVGDGTLPHIPPDPWGRPYQFRNPGTTRSYELYSLGPDGVESADDVVAWNLYGGR